MTRIYWRLNQLLMLVCGSYLTLGLLATERARDLWWVYAIVVTALVAAQTLIARRDDD